MKRNRAQGPASSPLTICSGTANAHTYACARQPPMHLLQLGYHQEIQGNLQAVSLQYILMPLLDLWYTML